MLEPHLHRRRQSTQAASFSWSSTDNGVNWTAIYTNNRGQGDLPDVGASAFADEDLTQQQLDLTIYSGQTIRLRFRFALGGSNVILWTQTFPIFPLK